MTLVVAVLGGGVGGGLWLVLTGWRSSGVPASTPTPDPAMLRRLGLALAGALVTLIVTRWPVAAIGGGVGAWFLARPRRDSMDATRHRTEAIALWTEMLRDAVGTARGLEGVLVATAGTAPSPIRPAVQRMAARLGSDDLDAVLRDLADDLSHPTGDLVVTALRLTASSGGNHLAGVLESLAAAAHADAESWARVEVARERPRAAMRYTAIIIGGVVALLLVFSRSYLAPYSTPIGQAVLVLVGAYWSVGIVWMQRMSRPDPSDRVLLSLDESVAA